MKKECAQQQWPWPQQEHLLEFTWNHLKLPFDHKYIKMKIALYAMPYALCHSRRFNHSLPHRTKTVPKNVMLLLLSALVYIEHEGSCLEYVCWNEINESQDERNAHFNRDLSIVRCGFSPFFSLACAPSTEILHDNCFLAMQLLGWVETIISLALNHQI